MESRAWPGVQEAEALCCVWGRQSEKTAFLKKTQKQASNRPLERLNSCQHKLSSFPPDTYIIANMNTYPT